MQSWVWRVSSWDGGRLSTALAQVKRHIPCSSWHLRPTPSFHSCHDLENHSHSLPFSISLDNYLLYELAQTTRQWGQIPLAGLCTPLQYWASNSWPWARQVLFYFHLETGSLRQASNSQSSCLSPSGGGTRLYQCTKLSCFSMVFQHPVQHSMVNCLCVLLPKLWAL